MRIVLTQPYCWPYVRRGSERNVAELARFLTRSGHEVVTISAKPGKPAIESTDGGTRILTRQLRIPAALSALRIHPHHPFLISSFRALAARDADVVHTAHYVDGYAAVLASRWRSHKTVVQINGTPVPMVYPRVPPDRWLLRQAICGADDIIAPSRFIRDLVRQYYAKDSEVIPVPVDLDVFTPGSKSAVPTILSVASFDERRKGVRVLVKAFARVKTRVSNAVLNLSGQVSTEVEREVLGSVAPAVRRDVHFVGVGPLEDLPRLYREASVFVLPSMWEAQGMVVTEALACGTPVVLTNHGGFTELAGNPGISVLFDPKTDGFETENAEGLADAIIGGLALSDKAETARLCRRYAERYSWPVLGLQIQSLYERLLERRKK